MKRFVKIAASLAALVLSATGTAWAEPAKGGVIDVATIGEPPTLDGLTFSALLQRYRKTIGWMSCERKFT